MGFKLEGILFMLFVWTTVIAMLIFCFWLVFKNEKAKRLSVEERISTLEED